MVIENKLLIAEETATRAIRLALEWNKAQGKEVTATALPRRIGNQDRIRASQNMQVGAITYKTDAAWSKERNRTGLAWNFTGPSISAPIEGSISQAYISSPFVAEALAVVTALGSARDQGFSHIKVFSDCSTLIGAIKGSTQRKELIGIISDIRSISSGFTAISFSHFSRNQNSLSDRLAKSALHVSVARPFVG